MFLISEAHAQATATTGAPQSSMINLIMMGGIFVLMYFIMIRPQMKRAKEQKLLLNKIGKGDEVLTISGFVARVVEIRDQYVVVELAKGNGTTVMMQKSAIQTILPKDTMKGL
jgi:preprotein translocase subunit YajC